MAMAEYVVVITYGRTMGRGPSQLSLCDRHDTPENRAGYAHVNHGRHQGICTICEHDCSDGDDDPR